MSNLAKEYNFPIWLVGQTFLSALNLGSVLKADVSWSDSCRPGGPVVGQSPDSGATYSPLSCSYSITLGGGNCGCQSLTPGDVKVAITSPDSYIEIVWVDDGIPTGATALTTNDHWTWVTSNPSPISGSQCHKSDVYSGTHQHYFSGATSTLSVVTGDTMFCYVYLDPSNMPSEIMLQWNDGTSWEHRAYWGSNSIAWGTDGTNSRRYVGALPSSGGWVRLEVAASQVGLEGKSLTGMAYALYDGSCTFDKAGVLR